MFRSLRRRKGLLKARRSGRNVYYSLSDPATPAYVARYLVSSGVHTGKFGTIGGRLYAFGAEDPPEPALLILDVTDIDR